MSPQVIRQHQDIYLVKDRAYIVRERSLRVFLEKWRRKRVVDEKLTLINLKLPSSIHLDKVFPDKKEREAVLTLLKEVLGSYLDVVAEVDRGLLPHVVEEGEGLLQPSLLLAIGQTKDVELRGKLMDLYRFTLPIGTPVDEHILQAARPENLKGTFTRLAIERLPILLLYGASVSGKRAFVLPSVVDLGEVLSALREM